MKENTLPSKIFVQKQTEEDPSTLVIGYNDTLLANLCPGTLVVESSMSKTKEGYHRFGENTFLTKDLHTFELGKTFRSILSHNTLHLEKDLPEIMVQIHKHLSCDATLYFPLKPAAQILAFTQDDKWLPFKSDTYIQRDRADVEDAVLSAPFEEILIEEKTEHLDFYSREELESYITKQLTLLTTLQDPALHEAATELTNSLYKDHDPDKVFTLSSPWILLSLSNET